jgi:pimeloyl-ACP methyl ester carboxylesterase
VRPTSPAAIATLALLLALASACRDQAPGAFAEKQPPQLQRVTVGDVELHYTDQGSGTPIVFIHGGLADYREWLPVVEKLPAGYRAITYSRRYNFPNQNTPRGQHSGAIEAGDLAELLRQLKAAPAHVVGTSYGAYTALLLALQHPDLVKTLTVAEPPLMSWLSDLPGGPEVLQDFMSRMWRPAAEAFRAGNREAALRLTIDYFVGPGLYDQIPPEFRESLEANAREWEALTTSAESLPTVSREEIGRITKPTLIIKGEKTYPIGQLIDPELARVIPHAQRAVVPDGTHEMCVEHPSVCAESIHAFISSAP